MKRCTGRIRRGARLACLGIGVATLTSVGCVTHGNYERDMRRIEERFERVERVDASAAAVADVSAQLDELQAEVRTLRGRLDVAEKKSNDAIKEAQRARQDLAAYFAGGTTGRAAMVDEGGPAGGGTGAATPTSEELVAYRAAYTAWRDDDNDACIDRFRKFLQTYPSSDYADDAAFWMADCHFKEGDFKNAVLRFDDVVRNYPSGNKAPDALYRQGESLLRLGPGFHEAAKRAFERVIKEYPDSARAPEARRQIDLLAAG